MNPFFVRLRKSFKLMRSLPRLTLHIRQLNSVRLPSPVQKPIASTILPLSLTSAVRQRMRWSKSRIFVPFASVTPFVFFVRLLTHGLRRKGCDPPHCKTRRFVLLMLSVHGSRKQKTYKT